MKLDAIGIVAKDIKKSIKFYELFGLEFKEFSADHVEATTSDGLRIMLDSEVLMKKLNSNWIKPTGNPITLAFKCDSPKQVDTNFNKIIDAGHSAHKEPWDAFWQQRYASVLDPDGNTIDLFAAL